MARYLNIFLVVLWASQTRAHARSVGVFFALDEDWQALQETVGGIPGTRKLGAVTIFEIETKNAKIIAVKMGSGAVMTAISAQTLISARHLDLAFSVGPVGALTNKFKVGQWCRVTRVVPWQSDKWMAHDSVDGAGVKLVEISADVLGASSGLPSISVASGEQFVSSKVLRDEVASRTGCDAVDMNLFGLSEVLRQSETPSFHLRVVSDSADESAAGHFRDFVRSYNGDGGRMLAEIILSLPPDRTSPQSFPGLQGFLEAPATSH